MSLLMKVIKYDKELQEMIKLFNDLKDKDKDRDSFINFQIYNNKGNKILVFEENNKFYKVMTLKNYYSLESVYCLANNILNLDFFLPFEVEYIGKYLTIISQEKLTLFTSQIFENKINDLKKEFNKEFLKSNLLNANVNCFLHQQYDISIQKKIFSLLEFLNVQDLINEKNFGIDSEGNIKCIDLENMNSSITMIQLKEFIKQYGNFGEIIENYPQLLNIVNK